MTDPFGTHLHQSVIDPSQGVVDIDTEKDDAEDLSKVVRSIFVGVAGDVVVVALDGSEATFTVPAGCYIGSLRVKRVKSTGTTASGLVGLI